MSELRRERHRISLAVLEYEQLKEEQRQRIGTRDNLVYATLGAMAVLGGAMLQTTAYWLLLLLPPVSLVLGWTYLVNDQKISSIRRYISGVLIGVLTDKTQPSEVLGWEERHRRDPGQRARKIGQVAVNLTLFCVPAALALLVCVAVGSGAGPFSWVIGVEGFAVLFLGHQLIRNADMR